MTKLGLGIAAYDPHMHDVIEPRFLLLFVAHLLHAELEHALMKGEGLQAEEWLDPVGRKWVVLSHLRLV